MEQKSHGSPSFINIAVLLLFAVVIAVASTVTTYLFLGSKSGEQSVVTQPPVASQVQINVQPTTPPITQTTVPADETANWKTYRNEKYGFEVKYPPVWEIDDRITVSKIQTFLPIFSNKTDKEAAYPTRGDISVALSIENILEDVLSQTGQKQNITFSHWFESFKRQKGVKSSGDYITIITQASVKNLLIDRHQAFVQTYEYIQMYEGIPPIVKEAVINIDDENAFILQASSPLPDGRKLINIFDQMLSTFKFTN